MKKMIMLGVVASLLALLVGCSSNGTASNTGSSAETSQAPMHHDYKGERQ